MSLVAALEKAVKKPRVVLVHGIHTLEGTSNVGRLVPYFEAAGFEVLVFEYGYLHCIAARFRNPGIALTLSQIVRQDDHLVCHSNGAAIAWLAMKKHGMRCLKLSMIAPALDNDKATALATWTDVYYNACDYVVWFSRLFWRSAWGSMGRDGYTRMDALRLGIRNIDVANHAELPQICGHLAYFEPHILPRFAPYLVRRHLERT